MTSMKLLILFTSLCVTLVFCETVPAERTIFVSKTTQDGTRAHRLSDQRYPDGKWEQITGSNKRGNEISYFSAYGSRFPKKDIGQYFSSEYIGGFELNMRVCKLRTHQDVDSFILTSESCTKFASPNRIGEEFSFYVAGDDEDLEGLTRIYYASCQNTQTDFTYIKLSPRSHTSCGQHARINTGSFFASIPRGYACKHLSAPEGTTIQYGYRSGRISNARMTCSLGYRLRGNRQVYCGNNGLWEGRKSYCEPIECGNPRVTDPKMHVERSGPYKYGDRVGFYCDDGYQIYPPEAAAVCQTNGQWFYNQPECRPVDCKYPGEPRFGSTIANDGYELGAEIIFTCNPGYLLDGATGAVCMSNGAWSNRLPTCTEVRCPYLSQPDNGVHTGSGTKFVMGQEVIFQCNNGYSLVGESVLECILDERTERGIWSAEAPTCSQIRCPPPNVPENANILGSDYNYGAQIRFQCNVGYTLRGADVATCLNNGQWDSQPPTCHVQQCRDPGTPENAVRTGSSFTFGSVLSYMCGVGYRREGAGTIVCNENGRWTGKPPTCTPVGCPEIEAPRSGSKEGDTFVYGSKIEFSCFPGYEMEGANSTECLSNGRWSEEVPHCVECSFGFYKEEAGTGKCKQCPIRSYTTSRASNSRQQCICETDTHGPPGGPCQAVQCVYPAAPEHGRIVDCSTENNDRCTFSCNPGYTMEGTRSRICTPQGWNGHMPVCVACPPDSYKREEGSLACTPCPQNTHTPEGVLGVSEDSCICTDGFSKNEFDECTDIDECSVNNGGCEDTCINLPGSYRCKCTTGGYELNEDEHTCYMAQTCSDLEESPNNGYLTCRKYEETNGVTCGIKCDPGYFFVSGTNNYITCGIETDFEWSHRLVNKTARLPSCTREFYVDVKLPVTSTYASPFPCSDLQFSLDLFFERMRVQEFISNLYQCTDSSNSGRFCEVQNLELSCKDVNTTSDSNIKAEVSVSFGVLLRNKEEGAVHPSCEDSCKRQSLREMLGNAWNLTKEMESMVLGKAVGVDMGSSLVPIEATGFKWDRPKLLCEEPGRVLTKYRLCVPCDVGYYLPERDLDSCLPCPKGQYQNEEGQIVCKPCLPGSTTLTDGTQSPHMCNVMVTDYLVNTTETQSQLNIAADDDDEDVDLDSFKVVF